LNSRLEVTRKENKKRKKETREKAKFEAKGNKAE
jgi:hypothetical protein